MFSYQQIQKLSDLETDVYNYVILHLDQVVAMTIRELAENVHVSTTTILHFCNKMGCDGYTEFRLKIKLMQQEKRDVEI